MFAMPLKRLPLQWGIEEMNILLHTRVYDSPWLIYKAITKEEMIDMVISFHQSLATGLIENNYCNN